MTLTVPSDPATAEPAPIRVLLADDSAAIRTLARYSLSAKRGFALVAEATDGAEALSLFEVHRPDCVVLDIEMPGMGGFETLEELRRRSPKLPVVMMSGYSDEGTTSQARASGAAACVHKDQGLGGLADTVRRVTQESIGSDRRPPMPAPAQAVVPPPPVAKPDATLNDLQRLEYVVSHDFAEPARVISGFATLLESRYSDSLDEPGQVFVQHLLGGARRLQSMIDDLLVYSRAGRAVPRIETVDTGATVAAVREELRDSVPGRQVDVRIGRLPFVQADPAMLHQVFHHLVLNALIFNTAEVPQVRIGGRVVGESVVFTVKDNGIGISPEHCPAVFELFRRLNTREEYPGTGTGLALCLRLVEMQSGIITIDSTLGGETTVTVTLPAAPMTAPGKAA